MIDNKATDDELIRPHQRHEIIPVTAFVNIKEKIPWPKLGLPDILFVMATNNSENTRISLKM